MADYAIQRLTYGPEFVTQSSMNDERSVIRGHCILLVTTDTLRRRLEETVRASHLRVVPDRLGAFLHGTGRARRDR